MKNVIILVLAVGLAFGLGVGLGCNDSAPQPPVTQVAEPGDVIDQELMIALAQAKNFHHKATVYMSDGNSAEAMAAVRQILSLQFPPNAPEAEDVRNDARALLAKLLLDQKRVEDAMLVVNEGLAASRRESFFVANLYTVKGELHQARAAELEAQNDKVRADEEKRAAITAYDRSIKINEAIQKQLVQERQP